VVGAGGLGGPVALYLAAAGVGTLGIVDPDTVELSNLGRQILYDDKDLDRPKAACAQARLEALNPGIRVVPQVARFGPDDAAARVAGHDVVVEASDDLGTKFVANAACVAARVPLVVAAVSGWHGQLLVVRPGQTACYRCVYQGEPPPGSVPSCEAAGILGPVAGVVGSLQAVEALRICLGLPSATAGRLLFYDAARGETSAVTVRRNPACPACGTGAR
jgi:adenylyltransferase/sulfurtransferase